MNIHISCVNDMVYRRHLRQYRRDLSPVKFMGLYVGKSPLRDLFLFLYMVLA